jgi:hypothetical protein
MPWVGAPASGVGAPALGVGAPAFGVGAPALGVGAPALGVGAPALGVGAPAFGVCAPASVDGTARPNATAIPKSENILRRETISHSILSIIFDLLDFDDGAGRGTVVFNPSLAPVAVA